MAKMGAFMMVIFLLISSAQNTKFYRQLKQRQLEQESKARH